MRLDDLIQYSDETLQILAAKKLDIYSLEEHIKELGILYDCWERWGGAQQTLEQAGKIPVVKNMFSVATDKIENFTMQPLSKQEAFKQLSPAYGDETPVIFTTNTHSYRQARGKTSTVHVPWGATLRTIDIMASLRQGQMLLRMALQHKTLKTENVDMVEHILVCGPKWLHTMTYQWEQADNFPGIKSEHIHKNYHRSPNDDVLSAVVVLWSPVGVFSDLVKVVHTAETLLR